MSMMLAGNVGKVIYHDPMSGFGVVVFDLRAPATDPATGMQKNAVIAQGTFPVLAEGIDLKLEGDFIMDRKYGRQFKIEAVSQVMPVDVEGIERYLASGLVEGIGPALAELIVEKFGEKTLDVLDNHPERLQEVHGIGKVKAGKICESWKQQQYVQELMGVLSCVDVTMNTAQKIIREYGASKAVEVVKKNPYQLAYDIDGIGFKKADQVAQRMGLNVESPDRIEAALVYVLREGADKEGHVYIPKSVLVDRVLKETQLPANRRSLVEGVLESLGKNRVLRDEVSGQEVAYLPGLFRAEVAAASELSRLMYGSLWQWDAEADAGLGERESLNGTQARAVGIALEEPVSVLTGGPGTGKSYTMKALISELDRLDKKYVLCAPTGRAAKRLAESTGREAKTIHRTIGYVPGMGEEEDDEGSAGDRDIDDAEFVIVDEASMVDIKLASRLLKAIPNGAHLLLVGDVDQLPPVGAGNFLRDVIESGQVAVTGLTEIYRQEAGSNITVNAHAVNRGEMPGALNGDFFVLKTENGDEAAATTISLVRDRLPAHYGLRPRDIQVLTPMHRGPAGVKALNEALQNALNPKDEGKEEVRLRGTVYRVGDRVMQTKNDYDKGVFNGDVGWIVEIDPEMEEMIVDVDGRGIVYGYDETEHLVLAYASTVHKSQGSEYPCVVMVMLTEQYVMLQRNLLYTGITRAKKVFVMLSNEKAVRIAVGNNRVAKRYTALAERMAEGVEA